MPDLAGPAFPAIDQPTGRALLDVVRGCAFDDFMAALRAMCGVRRARAGRSSNS